MLPRRPPSGYHWCRKGFRVKNPDEIPLNDDILDTSVARDGQLDEEHTPNNDINASAQKDTLDALICTLPKPLPFGSVEDTLRIDPEYFNELEGSEPDLHADYDEHHHTEYYEEDGQEEYYEEDDGLGYYPDGVKRTLTDEQIAMFRHTELQQIERARLRALERLAEIDTDPRNTPDIIMSEKESGRSMSVDSKQSREQVPYEQRNKRKWEQHIERQDPKHGSITSRRAARELDEVKAADVDINYGGDAPALPEPEPRKSVASGRRMVSYADG